MDYTDIHTFLTIVSSDSLSKAAETLYISQPALSHRLTSLEKELDTRLIVRGKGVRTIELTESGKRFCQVARKWEELWWETQAIAKNELQPPLRIATVDSLNNNFMTQVCRKFLTEHSTARLNLVTMHSNMAYDAVENHEVDVAFVSNSHYFKKVHTIQIFKESMCFVCAKDSSYQGTLTPSELQVENEIFIPWGNTFLTWHDYWFGIKAVPKVKLDNMLLLESFLKLPDTWAVVPMTIAQMLTASGELHSVSLKTAPEERNCYMLLNDEVPHPMIRSFVKKFVEVAKTFPQLTIALEDTWEPTESDDGPNRM
jgi:DNA-binding transcriptional LysR family regulator